MRPGRARSLTRVVAALSLGFWACDSGTERPSSPREAPASPPPRAVVLVTIDTLRADVLGAYGSELGASPVLDRLAAQGVLFEQAQAASPNTLPAHSTLLTGLRPFRHGVRSNAGYSLADEQRSVAEVLAEAGYATGAEVAAVVLGRHTGIAQGFAQFRDIESPDVKLPEAPEGTSGDMAISLRTRQAQDITARGIEFLQRNAGTPFFLWLHYYDPHWPYRPPEPWGSRFQGRGAGLPSEQPVPPGAKNPLHEQRYAGEVAYVDSQLERLVAELRRLGLAEQTLLAITSDHGEALGEHGEDTHSYFAYQSTMHVPLLLVGPPELPRGLRVSQPVRATDLAPTLLDWLDAPPLEGIDGSSLLPLLEAPHAGPPRLAYSETIELSRLFGAPVLRTLREGRWKYVHKSRPALYDLQSDPGELRDLAAEHPEQRDRIRAALRAMIAEAGSFAGTATSEIDAATAAQLAALGYTVDDAGAVLGDELESLDATGPDAEDLIEDVLLITRARPDDGDLAGEVADLAGLSRRYPESVPVLEKLLDAQLANGLAQDALETLRRGVRIAPDKQRYWSNYAELLVKLDRLDEARSVLPEVLERFPCDHSARSNLANLYAKDRDHAARIALLEAGLAGCEVRPELQNELAYALATVPEASLRDGARALELASDAAEALSDNPLVLDTVAVAQAEAGQRAVATQTLARALDLARSQGMPLAVLEVLRGHAAQIAAGQAIRE